MKTSALIKQLQNLKKKHGDLEMAFSSDEEGNEIMGDADIQLYNKCCDAFQHDYVFCIFPTRGETKW